MDRLEFLGRMETRVRAQTCIKHVGGDWDMWNCWEMEYDPGFTLLQRVKKTRQQEFKKFLRSQVCL